MQEIAVLELSHLLSIVANFYYCQVLKQEEKESHNINKRMVINIDVDFVSRQKRLQRNKVPDT